MNNARNKKALLALAAAFAALLVLAGVLYSRLAGDAEVLVAEPTPTPATAEPADQAATGETARVDAPDFTVYDADGNAVKLSDFLGQPVVVNFWASWCGPCQSEMPAFDAVAAEYAGQVAFLMVNLTDGYQETQAQAEAFLEEKGYTFPVYFDLDSDAAVTYGIYGIPVTFFIDADGHAVAQARSAIDEQTLRTGLAMILPEEGETQTPG